MDEQSGRDVVLHFRDGTTRRGVLLRDFSPSDGFVEIESDDGGRVHAGFDDLKAVFFIKDPRRRDIEVQMSGLDLRRRSSGAPARVEFFDGEVIHGRVREYSVQDRGFFLVPTAPESNNERIFVVVQALKTLYVEALADGEG